jgi:hypothetical protein
LCRGHVPALLGRDLRDARVGMGSHGGMFVAGMSRVTCGSRPNCIN